MTTPDPVPGPGPTPETPDDATSALRRRAVAPVRRPPRGPRPIPRRRRPGRRSPGWRRRGPGRAAAAASRARRSAAPPARVRAAVPGPPEPPLAGVRPPSSRRVPCPRRLGSASRGGQRAGSGPTRVRRAAAVDAGRPRRRHHPRRRRCRPAREPASSSSAGQRHLAAVGHHPGRRDARRLVLHPAARRPRPGDPGCHRDDGGPRPLGPGGLRAVLDVGLCLGARRPDGPGPRDAALRPRPSGRRARRGRAADHARRPRPVPGLRAVLRGRRRPHGRPVSRTSSRCCRTR